MAQNSLTQTITAKTMADLWAGLKMQGPRVHCITNSVVQNLTANTLLAVGAVPSMSTKTPKPTGPFGKNGRCNAAVCKGQAAKNPNHCTR
jgi:hypothetical protein